jgi:hypothetical protein
VLLIATAFVACGGAISDPDAAVDASTEADVIPASLYHDMSDVGLWSTFDTTTLDGNARGFLGATFDGRYMYFAPNVHVATIGGLVTRYDTQAPFTSSSAWSTFSTSTLTGTANEFFGATFDGRYVYLVPNTGGTPCVALRYDTHADFGTKASWQAFDTTTLNNAASSFIGGTFDGRYVYFAPLNNIKVIIARYDTTSDFSVSSSWSTFDMSSLGGDFWGSVFDGRYLYLVPDNNSLKGSVVRYDTKAAFTDAAAWSTFDQSSVNPAAKGYRGAAFDGRYVYLVPWQNPLSTTGPDGLVVRYDTTGLFADGASWSTFDTAMVNSKARGYYGAAFDGRYVVFVPASFGVIARYDTSGSFETAAGWSTFDTKTVNAAATGFGTGAFDGRYLYFIPYRSGSGSLFARFDAKIPASMPALPAWNGSFF